MVLLWLLPPLALQGPPEAAGTARIEGRVVSATSGEALARASVYLRDSHGATPYATKADSAGRFAFSGVAPGAYLLVAEKPGYLSLDTGARLAPVAGAQLRVAPGQHRTDLVLKLPPQSVLVGRVVDEEGEPIAYAAVSVLRRGYSEFGRRLLPVRQIQANELGEFRAAQLPAGRYFLLASARPAQRGAEGYASTFYPSATEEAAATAVDLAAGQELGGFEIRLRRTPLFRIRGRLAGSVPSEGSGRVRVMLAPRGSGALPASVWPGAVKQDSFEIANVPPGSYVVTVIGGERAGAVLARLPVEVAGGDVEGLVVPLAPPVELRGVVRVEDAADAELSRVRIWLVPSADGPAMPPQATVQRDGSFRLPNVTRDTYRVRVAGIPGDLYLKSVRLAGQEILGRPADLAVPGATLEIVLAPGAGQIQGVVQEASGEAAFRCTVTLVPDPPAAERSDLYKATSCNADGRFRLTGVAPGAYKLYAWEAIESGAERDPEFLRGYEGQGVPVRIAEDAAESVQLRLIRGTTR